MSSANINNKKKTLHNINLQRISPLQKYYFDVQRKLHFPNQIPKRESEYYHPSKFSHTSQISPQNIFFIPPIFTWNLSPWLYQSKAQISEYSCKRQVDALYHIQCPTKPIQSKSFVHPMLVWVARPSHPGTSLCRPGFTTKWKIALG